MCSLPALDPGDIFHLILNVVPNYLITSERERERENRKRDGDVFSLNTW